MLTDDLKVLIDLCEKILTRTVTATHNGAEWGFSLFISHAERDRLEAGLVSLKDVLQQYDFLSKRVEQQAEAIDRLESEFLEGPSVQEIPPASTPEQVRELARAIAGHGLEDLARANPAVVEVGLKELPKDGGSLGQSPAPGPDGAFPSAVQ